MSEILVQNCFFYIKQKMLPYCTATSFFIIGVDTQKLGMRSGIGVGTAESPGLRKFVNPLLSPPSMRNNLGGFFIRNPSFV
jgi:hypothetical protein